ncbi:MAG: CbbQ/NirQ/NorQ/GpvN family protein [Leptospiraceae bacterium]|nr:MAG: CbbQ/NirQ/NorQ/GpvN family protein [Leptospiraceae bacterium]
MKTKTLPYYKIIGKEVEIFEYCYNNQLPLLLKGPTGCGKSRFVEFMAERYNKKLITVSCHEETSAIDLIGRFVIKGTETIWVDGPLTKSVRENCWIYIDEIAEARPDVLVAIHSLTDYRRRLYIDKTNEELVAGSDFMLIASYNPGYQGLGKEIKPSTKQRFVSIQFNYPVQDIEIEIILNEVNFKINDDIAKRLVMFANKVRNLHELGLLETVSTRLLVHTAKLIGDGLPPRLACEVGILNPLTDDPDILKNLKDIVALYF